ncbi:MAG: XTP/dITP diphosphatase [Oscillospiraceae bacterium]|nr:XTP/dITP diphosphatase [Oscillospiraceae bacterium]
MKIVAATRNNGKIKELQAILSDLDIEIVSQAEAGIDIEVEETGDTFEKNALIKAKSVSMLCDDPVIADDSGLCVEALGGAPGVYSARYAGENASDEEKNNKILAELGETKNRKAKFVCVTALVFPDGYEVTATGETYGSITYEPHGEKGFGYDPIFYSDDLKKTFADADDNEKNKVSHRARALQALYEKLKTITDK